MKNDNRHLWHDAAVRRYWFEIDGHRPYIEYEELPGALALTRTVVPEELRGGGVAARLTEAVLEAVRARGMRVVPQCSYIVRYIERHPEWRELVREDRKE